MGNTFSNKYSPSKSDQKPPEGELSEVDSPKVADRKKKKHKKKSTKENNASLAHSESFGSTLRRSFRKRNPFRKSKRESKHKDKNGTAVEEETNGTGMNHPKIIVTSPSDVEASIGSDSPKKQVTVTQEAVPAEVGKENDAPVVEIKDSSTEENEILPDNDKQAEESIDTELDAPVSPDTDLETDIANALNFNIGIVNAECTGTRSDHVVTPPEETTEVDSKVESSELRSASDVVIETEELVIHVEELESKPAIEEPVTEKPAEEVSPGVIANPLLTALSDSSSSVDQDLTPEEISKHEQESQMIREQEAWEREEQIKKEELQRIKDLSDCPEKEEPIKRAFVNGKSASFDEDYPSEGPTTPFTPPPKSAPPGSFKPTYKELSNAPSPYSKSNQKVESPTPDQQDVSYSSHHQYSDDDHSTEIVEKKVELGTGAMADLARQPLSYRELSGVPTRQISPGPDDSKPEPRRRRRSRQASKAAQDPKKQLSVDVPASLPDDGSISPSSPPPVAPRPKNRSSNKPPPLPPKAGGSKTPSSPVGPGPVQTRKPSEPYRKASYRLYASLPRPKTNVQAKHAEGSISHEQLSFRDRRKYFEQEIKQQSLKKNKDVSPEGSLSRKKKISLVSDQDLKTIKREEEKKYGTLSKDEIRRSMDIDEDEEYMDDETGPVSPTLSEDATVVIEGKTYKVEKKPEKLSARERLNPNFNQSLGTASSEEDLIRSLEQDVKRVSVALDEDEDVPLSPGGSALDERLKVTSPSVTHDHSSHDLSPAEKRAQDAEKRKQWRQARESLERDIAVYNTLKAQRSLSSSSASDCYVTNNSDHVDRFKSLEADALQAQMVMTKEMMQQKGRRNESVGGTVA